MTARFLEEAGEATRIVLDEKCAGGGGALGHPLEYIKLDGRNGQPASCIYCGLRYKMKDHHH